MSRDVHSCTHWLRPRNSLPPPLPLLASYTRALLVSQDRRHLFVTPWTECSPCLVMSAGAARGRGGGQEGGGGVAGAVHLPVVPSKQGLRRLQPATTTIAHCLRRELYDFAPLPLLHDFHVQNLGPCPTLFNLPERKKVKQRPDGGGEVGTDDIFIFSISISYWGRRFYIRLWTRGGSTQWLTMVPLTFSLVQTQTWP